MKEVYMLGKFENDVFLSINKKKFDKFIIKLAYICIEYIVSSKINPLNNKTDGTPLSEADLKIDNIIRNNLNTLNPKIKILSEEYDFSPNTYLESCYWIIDPIDGTKSYISGGDEYTVNIALIHEGKPHIGLIAHPPSKKIWYAKDDKLIILENGVEKKIDNSKRIVNNYPTVIRSKENNQQINKFLNTFKKIEQIKLSSSLKFCRLAENEADFYPRFSSINKWDIAAGHAILNASGGELTDFKGNDIRYDNKSSRTGSFIALASKDTKRIFNVYNQL
jgi:3'(2'), 5'-bisphosphate nucleotidase